jgi:SAM-dependent methyltransferase
MQDQHQRLAGDLLEQLVCIADLDPDAAVLELDCGRGALATALLHYLRYGTYVGLDRQAAAVDWCRQQLAPRNPRFHFEQLSSPTELPLRDESFDFVVLAGDTSAALAEVKRVLRIGGAVFLSGSSGGTSPLAESGLTVVQPDVRILRRLT